MSKPESIDRALLDSSGSLTALRDHLQALMKERGMTAHELYDRMFPAAAAARRTARTRHGEPVEAGGGSTPTQRGNAAVSRSLFYSWFRSEASPSPRLLECVPALVEVFSRPTPDDRRVLAHEFYARAGVLEPDLNSAVVMQSAVREMARQVRAASRALRLTPLAGAAEALVVDRILRSGLDYEIRVWPVVRGRDFPMHLRSWIGLRPIERDSRRQRPATRELEDRELGMRRQHIRDNVITNPLWRRLGLRWREERPLEWPRDDDSELRIEMPVDEKSQSPGPEPWQFDHQQRILILSGLWGHGEPLANLLAGALDWGTEDVRYQGFVEETPDARREFALRELSSERPGYAWALAENADLLTSVHDQIVEAAARHLIVLVTYGEHVASAAAKGWRTNKREIRRSQSAAIAAVLPVNRLYPVIHVAYADADFADPVGEVDVNLFIDHVRYSAAEILLILQQWNGPRVEQWLKPERFEDLRLATSQLRLPQRKTKVSWHEAGTLSRGSLASGR